MQRDEFERLALGHLESIHRLAWQLTQDRDRADDLVQEVYLRAFHPSAIERFKGREACESTVASPAERERSTAEGVRSWLFTITHNTFYTILKKKRNERVIRGDSHVNSHDRAFESPSEAERSDLSSVITDPPPAWDLASLNWESVDERLKGAISGLSDEYRQVLILWSVQGMKYREIAQILDIPIGTVMSRLYRARKLLTDALGGENGPAADLGIRAVSATELNHSEGKHT